MLHRKLLSYWHCLHSMHSRVCVMVQCLSVCPGIQLHVAGECRQCHVCGIWRKLNTRLVDSPSVPLLYSVDPGIIIMVLQLFRLSRLPL